LRSRVTKSVVIVQRAHHLSKNTRMTVLAMFKQIQAVSTVPAICVCLPFLTTGIQSFRLFSPNSIPAFREESALISCAVVEYGVVIGLKADRLLSKFGDEIRIADRKTTTDF
jgi:hypothetical protein